MSTLFENIVNLPTSTLQTSGLPGTSNMNQPSYTQGSNIQISNSQYPSNLVNSQYSPSTNLQYPPSTNLQYPPSTNLQYSPSTNLQYSPSSNLQYSPSTNRQHPFNPQANLQYPSNLPYAQESRDICVDNEFNPFLCDEPDYLTGCQGAGVYDLCCNNIGSSMYCGDGSVGHSESDDSEYSLEGKSWDRLGKGILECDNIFFDDKSDSTHEEEHGFHGCVTLENSKILGESECGFDHRSQSNGSVKGLECDDISQTLIDPDRKHRKKESSTDTRRIIIERKPVASSETNTSTNPTSSNKNTTGSNNSGSNNSGSNNSGSNNSGSNNSGSNNSGSNNSGSNNSGCKNNDPQKNLDTKKSRVVKSTPKLRRSNERNSRSHNGRSSDSKSEKDRPLKESSSSPSPVRGYKSKLSKLTWSKSKKVSKDDSFSPSLKLENPQNLTDSSNIKKSTSSFSRKTTGLKGKTVASVLVENQLICLYNPIDESAIDICGYDNATLVLLHNKNILKLVPTDRNKHPGQTSYNITWINNDQKLEEICVFGGYLYGIAGGYLYQLDTRTYLSTNWKWMKCSWSPSKINHLSPTLIGNHLWIETSKGLGYLYEAGSKEPKEIEKVELNGCRRIYGADHETYLEIDVSQNMATLYPSEDIIDNIVTGAITYDGDIIRISTTHAEIIKSVRIVNWEPHYISLE